MAIGDGVAAVPAVEAIAMAQAVAVRGVSDLYAFHDACVLGTRLNLLVRAVGQAEAYAGACAARREIDRLDRVFNWRDADSELSLLNRSERSVVSGEMFAVVAAGERWREVSGGAYSGRLGRLLDVWRAAGGVAPDADAMARMAREITDAEVLLDPQTLTITRPDVVRFDLDGLAKGHIVDRALEAAMATAGVSGAMVDIGGDIRCAGAGPCDGKWQVGLPQPLMPFENAPACGMFALGEGAVATSGCGPRDARAGGGWISSTIDPRTGWPMAQRCSATAIAPTAMDADALATIALVSRQAEARDLLRRVPGMAARVTRPEGVDWLRGNEQTAFQWIDFEQTPGAGAAVDDYKSGWPDGWIASVTFSAPPKDMRRAIALRSPYVAIWVSDAERRTVRTLLLIGTIKEWQEYNHVWWRLNRGSTEKLLNGRSMSTRGSGTYKVFWDGVDDAGRPVKPGKYTLHVETSRERGEHTHRTLDVDFSTMRVFDAEMPVDAEAGGLHVSMTKF
ncbi:MAG: DUF2271 domain-containing protein [Hyphomonadaceae bacterium]|nr:DUF2271 domain-containing protein [Hyphomonadaceae bacterium]